MFRRRTLLVVGAGASNEVGLPIGSTLASRIAKKLTPKEDDITGVTSFEDHDLYAPLLRGPISIREYLKAARLISNGVLLSNSIDAFLNIHVKDGGVTQLGKAAIVRAILEAERHSLLHVDQSNVYNTMNFTKLEGTWYVKLMRIMGSSIDPSEVHRAFETVDFIIFNYDRCVEQFLLYSLQALYGMGLKEAHALVGAANIIHPYGSIGGLDKIRFGGGDQHGSVDYYDIANRIRTYAEQIEEGNTITRVREVVRKAECIIFLGFSYLEQNMALLKPEQEIDRRPIFGTAYQMSASDKVVVTEQIVQMFKDSHRDLARRSEMVQLNNTLTCSGLFDYYARSITAA